MVQFCCLGAVVCLKRTELFAVELLCNPFSRLLLGEVFGAVHCFTSERRVPPAGREIDTCIFAREQG